MLNNFSPKMTGLQDFGFAAELALTDRLAGLGYPIQPYSSNFQAEFDLMLDGLLPLEVKAARPKLYSDGRGRLRWRWQFNLLSITSAQRRQDFILALGCWVPAWQDFDWFIVPSSVLFSRSWLQITSFPWLYSGWLAPFRLAFSWLDFLLVRQRRRVNYFFDALPVDLLQERGFLCLNN